MCYNFKVKSVEKAVYLISLEQIEAIAQEESEEGTKVKNCYMAGNGSSGYYLRCNDDSWDELIFPCPERESSFFKGTNYKCTVKK